MPVRWFCLAWFWAICATGMLCGPSSPAEAAVYRWQDARGRTRYSSAPPSPPARNVRNVEIRQDGRWLPYALEAARAAPSPPALTTVVPYRKDQAVMTIPVVLNQSLERMFAVDTGSSYTMISHAVADALGLRPDPELAPVKLLTASGEIHVPLVNIPSLTVGGLTTRNVVAAIHDLPHTATISGLLGLNVLDRFTLTVDAARQELTFTATAATTAPERDCAAGRAWMQQGARLQDGSDEEAWLYQQALAACPNLPEAYYRLGHIYYQHAAYASAIAIHRRLLQVAPDEVEAYYRLGVLYLLDHQFALAGEAFRQTLRLQPDHQQAGDYLEQLRHGAPGCEDEFGGERGNAESKCEPAVD